MDRKPVAVCAVGVCVCVILLYIRWLDFGGLVFKHLSARCRPNN